MHVTIAHLSDIHFAPGDNAITAKLRPLAAAIASSEPRCKDYTIVLSGDIAHQGAAAEYEAAQTFCEALAGLIAEHKPGASVQYVTVPGNHDCHLPGADVNLRAALVSAIATTLQSDTPDNAILESVLAAQKNYVDFCDRIGVPMKTTFQKLYNCRTLEFGSYRVRFTLYNSALVSTRHEQQGTLLLPMHLIRNGVKIDAECDLLISVFHHPYNWLQADIGIAFRDHIEHTSEIVLTGHQHFEHAYLKLSLTGEHTLYSEGDVLQEISAPDRSGFRLLHLDMLARRRRVGSYKWTGSHFAVAEETEWQDYVRAASLVDQPSPAATFLDHLSDSGIGLTHPSKGPVPLDAVFVYPDVTTSALTTDDAQKDIKGENLLKYLNDHPKLVIRGSNYSGKTSLAKTIVKEWLRTRSFYPLLVAGASIKHADETSIDRLVQVCAGEAYGAANVESYRQLAMSAKALVIDDWDESQLSQEDRGKFLESALARFGKIVLFVRGLSYIHYVLARVKGTEAILKFDLVSMKDLSHVGRGELIEKWLSLDLSRDHKEFSRKVEETERLVQTVIGKNTLPSLPLMVLAILEASQRNSDVLPENGSFGYLYEVLITSALNSTQGNKPQLDKKYTFLSLLAYRLFESDTDILGDSEIQDLLDEYSRNYKVKVDKATLLRDLERTHVLVKADGNYSFGYAHYFYYFLARYFKDHVNDPQQEPLRKLLASIAGGLNSGNNGIFLMFFIYLTHDERLIDECVAIGDNILNEFAPSDLTNEVEFYNSKDFAGLERQIPESVDLEDSRRKRRHAADASPRKVRDDDGGPAWALALDGDGYSSDLPLATKLDYALSCIEILGQIIRNFTGSLPGDRKLKILRTTYLLGLRALRAMLMGLSDAAVMARAEVAKRDGTKAENRDLIKRIEKLLTVVGQILGGSVISNISMSVGSPDIDEDAYLETLDDIGRTNATELVDLAIRLDHFEEYPFNSIKKLHKQYSKNRFAQRVLTDLVISNMHVFDIGREMRQRVLSTLEVGKPPDSLISKVGKRLKE